MRCNHKNLLRINFIAQSRDQLEVKQELRLVAKGRKQMLGRGFCFLKKSENEQKCRFRLW